MLAYSKKQASISAQLLASIYSDNLWLPYACLSKEASIYLCAVAWCLKKATYASSFAPKGQTSISKR
jgi:hypothetical protein